MPHLSLEYSANLERETDMATLCSLLARTILDTGLFELGAIRVRAFRAEAYAIADEMVENGFLDMSFRIGEGRSADDKARIGEGRSADDKARTGEAIFGAATVHLAAQLARPHFALSLEIREIDADLSWKKNAIHPRLRGK